MLVAAGAKAADVAKREVKMASFILFVCLLLFLRVLCAKGLYMYYISFVLSLWMMQATKYCLLGFCFRWSWSMRHLQKLHVCARPAGGPVIQTQFELTKNRYHSPKSVLYEITTLQQWQEDPKQKQHAKPPARRPEPKKPNASYQVKEI